MLVCWKKLMSKIQSKNNVCFIKEPKLVTCMPIPENWSHTINFTKLG